MKGIIIYSNPMWGDNERATYCEYINNASFELTQYAPKEAISCLKGEALESSKTVCSEDDTYDFETGALIALMKMCGLEKSAKAYAEIFDDTAYGDALIERDKLKEKVDALYAYNKGLIDEIDQQNHEIIALKALKLTNESLKKDNASFRKACEKLKDENSNLKTQISVMAEKETELIDSNKRLSNKSETLNDALNTWKQRYRDLNNKNGELIAENYKLKTDCEKLQHGYIDTDMIICGGTRYGKQYKALVNLFRKLPQDKIEAAYKEVYNTELPVWKKEFLNQMYGIYKKSREKEELPTTLDINGTTYRKEISLKDLSKIFCPEELKVSTKREKMWDDILEEGRTPVYVERKDIHKFLEECQIAGVKWQSGKMPLEAEPFDMIEGNDGIYFFVMTSRVPNGFRHVMTWWTKAYDEDSKKVINYLPPMRWDLFKKGRLAVKVTPDNYKEFYEACEKVLGKKPWTVYTGDYTVSICKKDGLFEVFTVGHQKTTGKKIVNWEDVR